MDIISKLKSAGFIDLGFAKWEKGQGLQIPNLDQLQEDAPGVYVMHHEGRIQKVGKSNASLRKRLLGYRNFDTERLANSENGTDSSSIHQRKAIEKMATNGLSVLALPAKISADVFPPFDFEVKKTNFEPHDLEKKLIKLVKNENHPLEFGS